MKSSRRRKQFAAAPLMLAGGRRLEIGHRTLVMGVVNATPDSFFEPSRTPLRERAIERALEMEANGADIIDIGGESTRPGSAAVPIEAEIERVLPVIEGVRKRSQVALSVDTRKSEVARTALAAGADIVNDVSGLTDDPEMAPLIAQHGAICVLMHMRGTPETMQRHAHYDDVLLEVKAELGARVAAAGRAGIPINRQSIDPGIGFAKTARHSLEILSRLDELNVFERPLLVGLSRKSFLGQVLDEPDPERRLEGSLAAAAIAAVKGAHIIRVHDVAATVRALRVADAIACPARLAE